MEKEYWEYMMVICNIYGYVKDTGENIIDALNKLGKDGWEDYAKAVFKDKEGNQRIEHSLKRRLDPREVF